MAKLAKDLLISVQVAKPNSSEFIMLGNFILLRIEQQDKLKDTLIPLNDLRLLELGPGMWHFEKPLKIWVRATRKHELTCEESKRKLHVCWWASDCLQAFGWGVWVSYYKSSKVPSVVHFEKEKDADNLKQHGESGTRSS